MNGNLPPKSAEIPPEDFEGRLGWANTKITQLIAQAQAEGKSLAHSETGEPLTWTAVFSESHNKVVELNDAEFPVEPRTRMARTFPCERVEGVFSVGKPRMSKAEYCVLWEMDSRGVIEGSFVDSEGIDNDLGLNNLVSVVNAPDAEIVPFSEVFKRQ